MSHATCADNDAPGANTALLVIPGEPPASMNQQERMHWSARRHYRGSWKWLVHEAWVQAGRPIFAGPVDVLIRLYYPTNRRRDTDNAIGGAGKVIGDGLVACGCIEDDRHELLHLTATIHVDRDAPRTEIEIRERGGDG